MDSNNTCRVRNGDSLKSIWNLGSKHLEACSVFCLFCSFLLKGFLGRVSFAGKQGPVGQLACQWCSFLNGTGCLIALASNPYHWIDNFLANFHELCVRSSDARTVAVQWSYQPASSFLPDEKTTTGDEFVSIQHCNHRCNRLFLANVWQEVATASLLAGRLEQKLHSTTITSATTTPSCMLYHKKWLF